MNIEHWQQWTGRTESRNDHVTLNPVVAMAATMDLDGTSMNTGAELPPLWHWLYFTPLSRQSEIGPDGHTKRGGFLPPVELPRRMWAGGRLTFHHPLRVGDDITRVSRIKDISGKEGRSGALVFVTVTHEISNAQGVAISEEHDIVFRENPRPDAPTPRPPQAPTDETFSREIAPDPVLLFRYSALTFNGHRIHYDRSYVTEVEGYPGLIVHGPLIATLLVDNLQRQRPGLRVKQFGFRAVSPLFDIHRFKVCAREDAGGKLSLWARNHQGALAMEASAQVI
jgi:3-methylfumaryl-CoA hydratase